MLSGFIIAAAVLLLAFILLSIILGRMFLKNMSRKNPGEAFNANIDVSFYKNSPVIELAEKGLAYMDTRPKEEVYTNSYDGLKLHGTLFPADENPKNFVIGIHGFQSHALKEYAPHIEYYHSRGFSMLLPDDRAHDYSEGEYITMGVKDRLDCLSWAKYLVERFGPDIKILLHGVSMGGAAVLSASGEAELPPQVIGIVSDCGFSCIKDALSIQIRTLFHAPAGYPLMICRWCARHIIGYDFDEARPIDRVKEARVPIFFVQGSEDLLVPQTMAKELYEACSSKKKLLIVENANHAESIAVDPDAYHQGIEETFGI